MVCDRGVNAARNLAWLGLAEQAVAASRAETSPPACEAPASHSPHERNARGEDSAGRAAIRRNHPAKLASAKREAGAALLVADKTGTATAQAVTA